MVDETQPMDCLTVGDVRDAVTEIQRLLEHAVTLAETARQVECQRWIAKAGAAYTDAHAIFNDPPSETPQVVRDVIEWHLHTMRANEEA